MLPKWPVWSVFCFLALCQPTPASQASSASSEGRTEAPTGLMSSIESETLDVDGRRTLAFSREYPADARPFERDALNLVNSSLRLRGDDELPRSGERLLLATSFLSDDRDCMGETDCASASVFFRSVSFGGSGGTYYHFVVLSDPYAENRPEIERKTFALEFATSENGEVSLIRYENVPVDAIVYSDPLLDPFPQEFNYVVRGAYQENVNE